MKLRRMKRKSTRMSCGLVKEKKKKNEVSYFLFIFIFHVSNVWTFLHTEQINLVIAVDK